MSKLGELLVSSGTINQKQLQDALTLQKKEGGRIGSNLIKLGFVTEEKLTDFLSRHFGVPSVNLDRIEVDESVIKIIPADVARKYTILPISKAGGGHRSAFAGGMRYRSTPVTGPSIFSCLGNNFCRWARFEPTNWPCGFLYRLTK